MRTGMENSKLLRTGSRHIGSNPVNDHDWAKLLGSRLALLHESQREKLPHDVIILGRPFVIHPGVFSPKYFESSEAFVSMLTFDRSHRFLDLGTGCGVAAAFAALYGADHVLATDISKAAIENARENVATLGVAPRVEFRLSDVFREIAAMEKFTTIFWNCPWVWAPARHILRDTVEAAVCDPGYLSMNRFLRGARRHLLPGGHILVGIGNFARLDLFLELTTDHAYDAECVARKSSASHPEVKFQLFSLRPR